MEDETLELHFETINKSFDRMHSAVQEVATEQRNHAARNEGDFKRIKTQQETTETRITAIETSLTGISEKIRSNPLLTLGTGTIGGGGLIGAIAYYLHQGGLPVP